MTYSMFGFGTSTEDFVVRGLAYDGHQRIEPELLRDNQADRAAVLLQGLRDSDFIIASAAGLDSFYVGAAVAMDKATFWSGSRPHWTDSLVHHRLVHSVSSCPSDVLDSVRKWAASR
jgi:hypothetical protein